VKRIGKTKGQIQVSYAVGVVTPQTENSVAKAVQDLGLGFDVFNPKIRIPKVHRGRRVYHVEPMFRRYLLVRICEKIRAINRESVKHFIEFIMTVDDTLAMVPDKIVSEIKLRCTGDDILIVPRSSRFMQGELVRPKTGPFIDLIGMFEESSLQNKELATFPFLGGPTIIGFRKGDLVAA
jgi:transcriptional antiterminator RfaH